MTEWADFFADLDEITDPYERAAYVELLRHRFDVGGNPTGWFGIHEEPAQVQGRLGAAWLAWSSKGEAPALGVGTVIDLQIQ